MKDGWRLVVHQPGGPDSIERAPLDRWTPGPGEVRVRHDAVGVNYIDTYHRTGLYPRPLPVTLGSEAAGVVEAMGAGVEGMKIGDRVGYATATPGAYATHAVVPSEILVPIPDRVDAKQAAAAMLKGMTAWMLAERCGRVTPGQTVLVHAAAGGVGSLLVQWLKHIGATVIAHAGSAAKARRAAALGADHALDCGYDMLAKAVRDLTDGHGVNSVFDGVGADSWTASLASLSRRGLMISYGNASGPVPPVSLLDLSRAGSLFATRPTLFDYIDTVDARRQAADRLFDLIGRNIVKIDIGLSLPLSQAADAHRALEARRTTGSIVLIPDPVS